MHKRLLSVIALIIVLSTFLSSCKKPDEYGAVGDADISTTEDADERVSLFVKQELPFEDYEYETVDFESAKFSFDIPKTWKQTIYNMSCIRYDAPSDDPHFPGATFYLKCNYDYIASADDLDPFANMASEFSKPMSSYIAGLPFSYKGKDAWIKSYTVADDYESPSFSKDETAASVKITKDIILSDKSTGDTVSISGMDFVSAYFRWENFPVMVAAVTPDSKSADAKSMIEYIMSSTAYIPQKVTNFTERSYNNIVFDLPPDFVPMDNAGNIFMSPATDIKACSGMSIGVFRVEESLDMMSREYIQYSYADALATMMLDPRCKKYYTVSTSIYDAPGEQLVDEKSKFYGTVNILSEDEGYICAKMTYGTVGVWYMNLYITEKSDTLYLVADLFPSQDEAVANIVEKAVLQSLHKAGN